jgi:glycosyltransferase involved in cell wall biosynthesis
MGRYNEQVLPFKIVYIPLIDLHYLKPIVFSLLLPFYLSFYLLKLRPDCLYIRGATFITFVISGWAKLFGLMHIVEINGINPLYSWGKSLFTIFRKIDQVLGDFSMKKADKVITVTDGLKQELCRRYKMQEEKIAVVPNGTDIDVFKPLDKREARRQLGLDEDMNYICFAGSFYPHHGIEYIVKSVPLVIQQIPETRFILIGSGSEKAKIEREVREKNLMDSIIFIGEIPYRTVAMYINASDVCVIPTTKTGLLAFDSFEGSPLKLYDYLGCARPVVGTDVPGIGNFLESITAGISVRQRDADALAQAVIDLLHNPARAQRMGENGRKVIVERYTWRNTALEVAKICEKLLNL